MLSTKQVAEILGIHTSRVRHLIQSGKLKATKLSPRVIVVEERDLDAYMTSTPKMGRPRNYTKAQRPEELSPGYH